MNAAHVNVVWLRQGFQLRLCLYIRALKGKRLELSTPKSVETRSIVHGRLYIDHEAKKSKAQWMCYG